MGVEIEISKHGIELDNVHLSTVLKLLVASFVAGGSVGIWGGLQLATRLFTDTDEAKVC